MYTTVEIELLTDVDILHFFLKDISRSVSTYTNRKAIAINTIVDNYRSSSPKSYVMYLNVINVYGHAMSHYLPLYKRCIDVQRKHRRHDLRLNKHYLI